MAKKKRYHQSVASRMSESRGMERYETKRKMRGNKKGRYDGYENHYPGMDPRRRREMEDAGMIYEDHNAVANLPQYVVYREYPKVGYGMNFHLDDTARGVDNQMDEDQREMKREMFPEKY
jgi:hypothetical protein